MITKNNFDFKPVLDENLDILQLKEGETYTRLCYVTGIKSGLTKMEKGFFTFYVKDKNANIIAARLFNIADFIHSGFVANAFVDKPVKLTFMAQKYNGGWSLVIEEIELWTGDFDYSSFIGQVECVDDTLKSILGLIYENEVDIQSTLDLYRTKRFDSVCGGRVGGFLLLAEHTAAALLRLYDFDFMDKNLLKTYLISISAYYDYLTIVEKYPIIQMSEVLKLFNKVSVMNKDVDCLEEVLDTCRALFNLGKPQHLYSHLITNAINNNIKMYDMLYRYNSMPAGCTTYIGGETLLRY